MKPVPIGIVGGAGPLAGALLLDRVLSLSASVYGCYKDGDYPQIFLLSFPFSDMLSPFRDEKLLKKELKMCLAQLRQNGAAVLGIACNTLHVFLDDDIKGLVHLPEAVAGEILPGEIPLVLCTSTSSQAGLHKRFFPCVYPQASLQAQVDGIIDQILKGAENERIVQELLTLVQEQKERTIVLGCTELSLFSKRLALDKCIVDPLEILAKKILEISFKRK